MATPSPHLSEIAANLPKVPPRRRGDGLPSARHEISDGTLYDYGSHLFRISEEDKRQQAKGGAEEADSSFPHLTRTDMALNGK